MLKFISVIMMNLIVSSLAMADEGHETGNGGDAYSIEFQLIAKQVVADIVSIKEVDRHGVDVEKLSAKVENKEVKVITTSDYLYLNQERKDAINKNGNQIILSLKYWPELNPLLKRIIVLHEYLGLIDAEIGHYQISIAIVTDIENVKNKGQADDIKLSKSQRKKLSTNLFELKERMKSDKTSDADADKIVNSINDYFRKIKSDKNQMNAKIERYKMQVKASKGVLKCARKIIDRKRGGSRGVEIVAHYLKRLRAEIQQHDGGRIDELDSIARSCESNYEQLDRQKTTRFQQFMSLTALGFQYSEPKVFGMIKSFITIDETECTWGGVTASAALGVGAEGEAKAGRCISSNGRRWIDVSAGLGFGVGFGASAGIVGQTKVFKTNISSPYMPDLDLARSPIWSELEYNSKDNVVFVSLTCVNQNERKSETIASHLNCVDMSNDGIRTVDQQKITAVGLGLEKSSYGKFGVHLKLIPLGTDWNYLYGKIAY